MDPSPKITCALISVSDKSGLAEFAKGLADLGIEILSTGGTRRFLDQNGIPVRDISDYTGFPEMMDGRLKTLHPLVHGGILCRHDHPSDREAMEKHGIRTIELVVVNLYPFEATIARPDCTDAMAIENIDIGGPTMVRAASKNHRFTTIVTHPGQYAEVLEVIRRDGATNYALRRRLAGEAFDHTAKYDTAIAAYFSGTESGTEATEDFGATIAPRYVRQAVLRYGENPHQKAAVYADAEPTVQGTVVGARQLNGKELSYNNLADLDSAYQLVKLQDRPAAAVIKHSNPCGAAIAETLAEALQKAMDGDPLSAFGSVLGLNRECDAATAEVLCKPGLFVEAIIAPKFTAEALEILTTRPKWRANVRLMESGEYGAPAGWTFRSLEGGLLVQRADTEPDDESEWKVVTKRSPTAKELDDLRFAWAMVRHVKSNAITICKDGMLLGAGAGQMSRVDSTKIAIEKAGDRIHGAALGSDAFFPFPDSIEEAAKVGLRAVIQPGGSKGDPGVIEACDAHDIAMIFTGRRHFRH
ncbi:MAG: bifunctional phosphoribosylaminoimidazolecarboxamide formyltransferase/IMP cyclohydrolase [Planctomycetia bacterium]|nr:bifunctional phosphoribosylaminoimidazolecarboxamide formyltransferase/IMP cyclohydrolase [Planctomycetia bacterium]